MIGQIKDFFGMGSKKEQQRSLPDAFDPFETMANRERMRPKLNQQDALLASSPLSNMTVRGCIRLVSEAIAGMDMEVRREDARGRGFRNNSRYVVIQNPHQVKSRFDFWKDVITLAILHGICVLKIVRTEGVPTWLEFTGLTEAQPGDDYLNVYGFDALGEDGLLHPQPLFRIISRMITLRNTIGQNEQQNIQNAISKLIVKKSQDAAGGRRRKEASDQKDTVTAYYEEAASSTGRFMYVDSEDIQQVDAKVPDFSAIRAATAEEICTLFQLPLSMVQGKPTNEHEATAAFQNGILPWVRKLEAELSRKITKQAKMSVAIDHYYYRLSLMPSSQRAGYFSTLAQTGVFSANEIRDHEGLAVLDSPMADQRILNLSWATEAEIEQGIRKKQ